MKLIFWSGLVSGFVLSSLFAGEVLGLGYWETRTDDPLVASPYTGHSKNPAHPAIEGSQAGVLLLQDERETVNTSTNQGNPDTIVKSKVEADGLGLKFGTDLGGDSSLSLIVRRIWQKNQTTRTDLEDPVIELQRFDSVEGRFSFELSSQFSLGIGLRFAEVENVVYGAFFLDESQRTRYKSSLSGFSAGASGVLGDILTLTAAYLWPMRGKTEVISEEKLVKEPGIVELGVASLDSGSWGLSGVFRRWIHERDERAEQTTLASGDRSIDIRGLDPNRFYFPHEELGVGFWYGLGKDIALLIGVTQETSIYIFDSTSIPESDSSDKFSFLRYHAGLSGRRDNLQFGLGAKIASYSKEIETNSQGDTTEFESDETTFTAALTMDL